MTAASQMLEIPEVRALVSPVTVAQYHQFPEFNANGLRTELVHGVVIEKRPKSPLPASIAKLLYDGLHATVPSGFSVRQDQPLTLKDSEPEPDIAIVRGSVQDYRTAHPATVTLIIEIATSSASLDHEKATLYAHANVEEYWIIQPTERQIDVYRRPEGGTYLDHVIVGNDANLECGSLPGIVIRLSELLA